MKWMSLFVDRLSRLHWGVLGVKAIQESMREAKRVKKSSDFLVLLFSSFWPCLALLYNLGLLGFVFCFRARVLKQILDLEFLLGQCGDR